MSSISGTKIPSKPTIGWKAKFAMEYVHKNV